ncbi:uncharacterized protein LOC123317154 [Coccinella septempunctata]|uniref:uncharacterized protein LOC123317154 n=1 Tax=Coccinella septempunctata TaxID=41139 RepID=UPI001D077993|nr:uncharacterized protein LOC123317154 [Coccinella septempunctata]
MVLRRRNKSCIPYIFKEGSYSPPSPCRLQGDLWHRKLRASDRLFNHQTLASARKSVYYKPNPDLIPRDDLDYILASSYLHNEHSFIDPIDPLLQAETMGDDTFRRLRNTIDIHPQQQLQDVFAAKATSGKFLTAGSVDGYVEKPECIPYKYHESHPVLIGGTTSNKHPMNIKLMNSSHHAPQTNAGYSRQDADGTFFQY